MGGTGFANIPVMLTAVSVRLLIFCIAYLNESENENSSNHCTPFQEELKAIIGNRS
jgi:hypothetical protein